MVGEGLWAPSVVKGGEKEQVKQQLGRWRLGQSFRVRKKPQSFLAGVAVFFAPTAGWVGSQIPRHPPRSEAGEGLTHVAGVPDCGSAPTPLGLFLKGYHGV